MFIPELG